MKVLALPVAVAAMLLVLAQNTQSVYIQYEGFQVKLDSVKKLDELLEQPRSFRHRMGTQRDPSVLCSDPALPSDLQPVCENSQAANIFRALRSISQEDCELCINVACTGC
uniref:Guanylate cyclase activator 2B n=1 Tax=Didelphis virginiana TaxID=9267 RepID=GUC2B_DIDVI|nr:RecName: Full=Guanylate cyclase activator 2B; Contains: RecName: Full=Uroguanylin; Short=UGN; Flags: Precursor [Didelphis virginiana]AAB00553.1 preprouroguanylin [Didelphis virginiana]